jgi:hypothetical protein
MFLNARFHYFALPMVCRASSFGKTLALDGRNCSSQEQSEAVLSLPKMEGYARVGFSWH